jgi:hypothetical protein
MTAPTASAEVSPFEQLNPADRLQRWLISPLLDFKP